MLHSPNISIVAIPDAFTMVTISAPTINSTKASFMIDSSEFMVTNDDLELRVNGGDGVQCVPGIIDPATQPINVTCTGLDDETSYSLTVDLSDNDNNCLMILISFVTPSTAFPPSDSSTGMLPV